MGKLYRTNNEWLKDVSGCELWLVFGVFNLVSQALAGGKKDTIAAAFLKVICGENSEGGLYKLSKTNGCVH